MTTDARVPGSSTSRTRCGALAGLVTALCAVGLASPSHALGNFTRHITITVGAGVVAGPHANFPVLVDVTNGDLATTPGGSVQSTSGYDIVFRGQDDTTCGGAGTSPCMLDHEIELYDGTAGRVLAWVRVPSLVASTSVIHMYYGNNQITSPTETPGAVFDANYVGVWHLKESGNGGLNEYRDSSRYGNNGQGGQGAANAIPARVNGKIGYGQRFDKAMDDVGDFIDAGQDGSLNVTGNQITLEGWVNHDVTLTYSTGTASVNAGETVVNFTGATLPAWVGDGDYIDFTGAPGENNVRITSRNSSTQVTLSWGAQLAHTGEAYTIRAGSLYGVLNHKGYYDGYRLYLSAGQAACPSPSGALTDPCLGFAVPGQSDQVASSQYGSPATDPVTRGWWHHVVGTYDNTEMKLYVDGQKLLAVGNMGNHTLDDSWCNPGGCAQIAGGVGGTVMTFDHNLPAGVAAGDVVTFDTRSATGPVENLLIQSVDSLTQVTVATGAAYDHSTDQSFTITSPFKTGNVSPSMAEQHVWIGHGDQQQNVGWSSPWVGDLDEVRISRVARSADWIQTQYNNQSDPGTFSAPSAPAAAPGFPPGISLPTLTTVYRSIGTNAANLSAGTASAASGATTVTFGASIPANLGPGDQLDFTGVPAETLFILSRDSATQVTVQTPVASDHTTPQTYTIRRAYNTLQAWEDALPADLVAANVHEVGVAFDDGPLAAVTFSGSVTDPARSILLTTNVADRQRGIPNSGVVLNNTSSNPAIAILDDHITVERFEITGGSGTGAHGIEIASVNPANLGTVRYNLIHHAGGDGARISDADGIVDIYNNFIFNTDIGIRLLVDMNAAARVNIFNNTVYSSTAAGIASRDAGGAYVRQSSLRVTLRQNIAHSSPVNSNFDIARAFTEGYFCTAMSGTDPTTCTNITTQIGDRSVNDQLPFASATTCLYVGSTHRFRGVGASVVTGGAYNPNLAWDYWNGTATAWTSLATQIPAFRSHDFQWDGFAYWPDELSDWAPRTVNGGASLYYVRACGYYTYTDGYASVDLGGTTVTFSNNLPAVVGAGDTLFFTGGWTGTPETLTIASRVDNTHVTITTPAAFDHSGGDTFGIPDASFGPTEELITRADVSVASRYNLARDQTGYYGSLWHGVGITGLQDSAGTGVQFTSATDLHILTGSIAKDALLDTQRNDGGWESSALTSRFLLDVDYQARPAGANGACSASGTTCWDIGADEWAAPTAVRLMSFSAVAGDGSVTLEWRTGSELDNLGFHVHRGPSADGPWTRLTSSLIPGLGSSPLGQSYSWLDTGLVNGVRYYYRLEDVDTASVSTFHGPVSAVPGVTAPSPPGGGGGGGDGAEGGEGEPGGVSCPTWILAAAPEVSSPVCTKHGDPGAVSLDVLSRDALSATLELRTGGFWALHVPDADGPSGGREPSGTVRVFVPGLDFPVDSKAPALPLRRAFVDAVVGKQVQLASAEAFELQAFHGLRPSAVGVAEMSVSRDGTVRPARRPLAAPLLSRGYLPQEVVRLAGTVFLGERKSAVVEITPVRFDGARQQLVLAGRVRVRLAFTGVVEGESGTGSRGRAVPRKGAVSRDVLAQLHTSRRGLHAVRYEDLFAQRPRGLSTLFLRLQRQGEAVPFHVEPSGPVFGPGSVLYFYADRTASSMDYASEVAYELVRASGVRMETVSAPPLGALRGSSSTGFSSFETNRIYQPGLLEAEDLWLWDYAPSGASRTEGFALSGVDTASGEPARLVVHLQGGSESGLAIDHHLLLSVNGASVEETSFAGKRPHRVDLVVPASSVREGANELSVVNVGDTGVVSSVFLDRFEISYPQTSTVGPGVFEGVWAEGGTVEVSGLTAPPVILRDTGLPGPEGSAVRWLTGFQTTGSSVRFQAEAGQRYLVVTPEGLLTPRVGRIRASTLRDRTNQADYLVIAPRELLEAAAPLLERRTSQGLLSRAVAFEEIASEFGHGQPSAEAIRSFLSYAYHSWPRPSPRYVLLLGDATDDPRHFVSTSWASPLPALLAKTSYLWTVSDPALGAVNGEDLLPDLAIGRLPATTVEQAEALVSKLLAWEDSGQGLAGNAVLVADKPDSGGDFEADVEDIRQSFLGPRSTTTLRVSELGTATRPAILDSFDEGASLMSYVGHGGTAVWSTSNVLSTWDAASLRAQSRQPLLLTMNCLNGYFVAPNLDALPEALLKAQGRGAIAAFSPSGLSLDGPAHQYHRAVVAELVSGRHVRLGDAILAAQDAYARTGLMPELITVYQLLGDPATKVR